MTDENIKTTIAHVTCAVCGDTGVIETGNNDLPCEHCVKGKTAIFHTCYGKQTGEQMLHDDKRATPAAWLSGSAPSTSVPTPTPTPTPPTPDTERFLISEALRTKLRQGKYTAWAENITFDQLQAVLWAVGEFACRAREEDYSEALADAHAAPQPVWEIHHPRQAGALKILIRARRRPGIGLEEAQQMIRDANARKATPSTPMPSTPVAPPVALTDDQIRAAFAKGKADADRLRAVGWQHGLLNPPAPSPSSTPDHCTFCFAKSGDVLRIYDGKCLHCGHTRAEMRAAAEPAPTVRLGMHTFSGYERAEDKDICTACGCHRKDPHHLVPVSETTSEPPPPKRHKYVGYEGTCLDCDRPLYDAIHDRSGWGRAPTTPAPITPASEPYECSQWPSPSLSKHGKDLPTICNELHARGREVVQAFPRDDGGWGVLHRARAGIEKPPCDDAIVVCRRIVWHANQYPTHSGTIDHAQDVLDKHDREWSESFQSAVADGIEPPGWLQKDWEAWCLTRQVKR